jgi:MFS transporter, NNP family, nitrate/nitrite transporter
MATHASALSGPVIADWRPEDENFWSSGGSRVANRNLTISVPALFLAFAVWMVWSVVVAKLPLIGFAYTPDQLFLLAALPGLSGATLRIFYSFVVPVFGGRRWTAISTASLLLPAIGIGLAVQNPDTPYWLFVLLALLCGLGGGNFASSMAHISFFYPKARKGNALAINAGLGNLGVSAMQFIVPIVIAASVFGAIGGSGQIATTGEMLFIQNAGFIWVPFILIAALAAWFGMNDLETCKASVSEQSVIFKRKHNWIMCLLYVGTFGSFIGFSAAFPLLAQRQFPEINVLAYAFLGPLISAVTRAATGWVSDKYGGARVTLVVFAVMTLATFGVILAVQAASWPMFFGMFLLIFFCTGVGNASTFQMVPVIMRKEVSRLMPELHKDAGTRQAEKEAAAIIGFTSAVGAYGAFFIPKAFGTSIAMTGTPVGALYLFIGFYALCIAVTYFYYVRKSSSTRC